MNFLVSNDSECDYFSVEMLRAGSPARLCLNGELDLGSAHLVSDALMELEVAQIDPVVVDMASVSFMDCSGLSVLVGAYNRACRDDRELVITNPQPAIRRIFALTGCSHLLTDPQRETLKA